MTKDYMNKVFGETKDPTEVRNNYFIIEPRQKRAEFLDPDEKLYMEQHIANAKASNKNQTLSAKTEQANAKLALEFMTNAGEPKFAKNMGNPESTGLNQYKFVKENNLPPKVVTTHGDPL